MAAPRSRTACAHSLATLPTRVIQMEKVVNGLSALQEGSVQSHLGLTQQIAELRAQVEQQRCAIEHLLAQVSQQHAYINAIYSQARGVAASRAASRAPTPDPAQ